MTQPAHATLAAALAAFQGEVKDPHRGRTANVVAKSGAKYSYTYADLGDLLRAVRPTLSRHGLAVSQVVRADGPHPVLLSTLLHATSAERLESTYPLHWPSGAQERGSELTYARRYSLEALLGVAPSEEDDDGQAAQNAPRQEPPWQEPPRQEDRPPAEAPKHHPTWAHAQKPFCASLARHGVTYDALAAYLERTGKRRPSAMTPDERSALSRALETQPDLVARVLAVGVDRG